MRIEKVINHNVVVVWGKDGKEQIVMGRGIAFQKRRGDEIVEGDIDKIFALKDEKKCHALQQLIEDIPLEYFDLVEEILLFGQKQIKNKIDPNVYISLMDHIYMAITRMNQGIIVKNPLLWDIKRYYPDEFQTGKEALRLIQERCGVTLSEDEAGFIALHLANAQVDQGRITSDEVEQMLTLMQEVESIVKYYFSIDFCQESVYYHRFLSHIKFFAQRIFSEKTYDHGEDSELLALIQKKYEKSYACVERIALLMKKKYQHQLSLEEKMYLAIHIERVVHQTEE